MSSRKNVKRYEGDAQGGKDSDGRLGNLPEAILGHILSLLPIEDAVRTSVLSSTWRFKWACITHLRFDDRKVCESPTKKEKKRKAMFVNFVERILLLLGNCTIQEFRLRCSFQHHDANQISKWIVAAMRHDARMIDIHCDQVKSLAFPCLTNCCEAVEELRLQMNCTIKIISSISFSSLRVMDLCDITFLKKSCASNSITGLEEIEFSFNVLEILKFIDCRWRNSNFLRIKAPKLTSITPRDYNQNNGINSVDERLTCACLLVMTVPKLTKFESSGYSVPYVRLEGTSAITDLSVKVHFSVSYLENAREMFVKLLQAFSNAKKLNVSSNIVKHDLPKLNKLKLLEVECVEFDEQVTAVLRCAPVLEYLIFDQDHKQNQNADLDGMVPPSVLSHLKVAKFHAFYGRNAGWLELAKFLLKNARVLEKMIIKSRSCLAAKEIDELLECPRCSSSASVKFIG